MTRHGVEDHRIPTPPQRQSGSQKTPAAPWPRTLWAVLVICLLAAGCGSSSTAAESEAAAEPPAATEAHEFEFGGATEVELKGLQGVHVVHDVQWSEVLQVADRA